MLEPLSRAVNEPDGLDGRPAEFLEGVVEVRSSLRGRCRALTACSGGDGGSFFTMIFGGWPERVLIDMVSLGSGPSSNVVETHEFGDDRFASGDEPPAAVPSADAALWFAALGERRSALEAVVSAVDATVGCVDLGLSSCWTCEWAI
jgi:hypothetical protein